MILKSNWNWKRHSNVVWWFSFSTTVNYTQETEIQWQTIIKQMIFLVPLKWLSTLRPFIWGWRLLKCCLHASFSCVVAVCSVLTPFTEQQNCAIYEKKVYNYFLITLYRHNSFAWPYIHRISEKLRNSIVWKVIRQPKSSPECQQIQLVKVWKYCWARQKNVFFHWNIYLCHW